MWVQDIEFWQPAQAQHICIAMLCVCMSWIRSYSCKLPKLRTTIRFVLRLGQESFLITKYIDVVKFCGQTMLRTLYIYKYGFNLMLWKPQPVHTSPAGNISFQQRQVFRNWFVMSIFHGIEQHPIHMEMHHKLCSSSVLLGLTCVSTQSEVKDFLAVWNYTFCWSGSLIYVAMCPFGEVQVWKQLTIIIASLEMTSAVRCWALLIMYSYAFISWL